MANIDWITLVVRYPAPQLHSDGTFNYTGPSFEEVLQKWVDAKSIPKSKILLGVSSYGKAYRLVNVSDGNVEVRPALPQSITSTPGRIANFEILAQVKKSRNRRLLSSSSETQVTFLKDRNLWVVHESSESLARKMKWAVAAKFGGAKLVMDADNSRASLATTAFSSLLAAQQHDYYAQSYVFVSPCAAQTECVYTQSTFNLHSFRCCSTNGCRDTDRNNKCLPRFATYQQALATCGALGNDYQLCSPGQIRDQCCGGGHVCGIRPDSFRCEDDPTIFQTGAQVAMFARYKIRCYSPSWDSLHGTKGPQM